MSILYAPVEELWRRVLARTTKSEKCWEWQGALNSRGYGLICSGRKGKSALVHRIAVINREGGIAEGLTVDHLCMNKKCVNPDHLEVVTVAENNKRARHAAGYHIGGACGQGHPLTDESTRRARNRLICKECERLFRLASIERNAEDTPAHIIRDWALYEGIEVAAKGRLSPAIRAAYEEAHPPSVLHVEFSRDYAETA